MLSVLLYSVIINPLRLDWPAAHQVCCLCCWHLKGQLNVTVVFVFVYVCMCLSFSMVMTCLMEMWLMVSPTY